MFTTLCFSQDFNAAMEVSEDELTLNTYKKDTTANAVVIYDYGNSFFDKNTFALKVQIKQKIKILKPEGKERGEFEITLYKGKKSSEKIREIKGVTYNLENGIVRKSFLESKDIFKIEEDNYTLVKFALPKVKVGSIITISYETESRFIAKYQPWYFQGGDPVIYSEYNTSIPANYKYNIKLVGGLPLDIKESNVVEDCILLIDDDTGYQNRKVGADCTVSKYIMKDIPAYKSEDYTTTSENYISRIEYELNEIQRFDGTKDKIAITWKDVDGELKADKNFGRQINKKSLVSDVLPSNISKLQDPLEKVKSIRQYVIDTYKWNGKNGRYDVSIRNLLKEKTGSAFEINLLLQNLLYAEGFESYPILLSTRKNGLIAKIYPVLTEFNFVIVKTSVDGKTYLLDATMPYNTFGQLPFKTLNQYGRLIDFKDGSRWFDIEVEKYAITSHRVILNNFDDDGFYGTVESKYTSYNANGPKQSYNENPTYYKEGKINSYSNISIENHDIISFDKNADAFNEQIDFYLETETIGNKIYLNPLIIKFFKENPFKLQNRTYPVDFGYKKIYSYVMNIELNDSLKVLETPKIIRMALPENSGSLLYNVEVKDNKVTVFLKIKFDKAIYPSGFYEALKILTSKIIEIQNNSIILLEKQ